MAPPRVCGGSAETRIDDLAGSPLPCSHGAPKRLRFAWRGPVDPSTSPTGFPPLYFIAAQHVAGTAGRWCDPRTSNPQRFTLKDTGKPVRCQEVIFACR